MKKTTFPFTKQKQTATVSARNSTYNALRLHYTKIKKKERALFLEVFNFVPVSLKQTNSFRRKSSLGVCQQDGDCGWERPTVFPARYNNLRQMVAPKVIP